MKKLFMLGLIVAVAVFATSIPGNSYAGARIFVPFPGGQVVVNPDGSGGVRFPGGGVSWPGAGRANPGVGRAHPAPVPHPPKLNELGQLEQERYRLESDIGALDKRVAQQPEGEAKRELLRQRREMERNLSDVLLKIERLRSSQR